MNKFGIPQSVLDAVSGILNKKHEEIVAKHEPKQIDETMSVHVKPHENGTHYTVTKVGAAMKKHGGVKVGDKLSDTHIDDLHDSDVQVHHEEVQQVNELEAKTLGSYVRKATNDALSKTAVGQREKGRQDARKDHSSKGSDYLAKADKRHRGVELATKKLVKKAETQEGAFSRMDVQRQETERLGPGKVKGDGLKTFVKKPAEPKTEAKDLDTGNVDKALQHDCASHVVHKEWGNGLCIPGQHTLVETEEGKGVVTHYDVLFDHGIEEDVAVEDLDIVKEMSHGHPKKKKMSEMSSKEKMKKGLYNSKLDPVGQEDDDVDNDGDVDDSDGYIKNRRKKISANIKKKVTEAADNRQAQSTGQASNMAKHYYDLAKKASEAGNTASAAKFMRLAKSFYRKSEGMQDKNKQGQQQQVGELYWSDEELAHLSEKSGLDTKTLASYMTKASDARGHRKLSTKKVDNRYAGVKKASDELDRRNTMGEASGQRVTKAAKEEPEHIGVQLRKVVNIGPNHGGVEFSNGKKEKVHPSTARRAMDRYNRAKPAEREELQKHMAHSHDALKHVASGGSLDSSPAK